jgi:hypothetical protein
MKKLFLICSACFLLSALHAQTETTQSQIKGTPILKVFGNFHKGLKEVDNTSAFEIKRAYFGYKFDLGEGFNAEVKLDIGSPDDAVDANLKRRFAYFKTASLSYKKGNLKLNFGLIGMNQFKVQEKFWGNRYIEKSFQDKYKFGSSADIGIMADYKVNDLISIDAAYVNGEGYSKLQSDDEYKVNIGTTIKPIDGLSLRLYYDIVSNFKSEEDDLSTDGIDESEKFNQQNIASFLGYQKDKFKLAFEYNYQLNNKSQEEHNLFGYSIYGAYKFANKFEAFARYDKLNSNKIADKTTPWNLEKDGSAIITGIQYQPVKRVKMALNYQDWVSDIADDTSNDVSYIYLNLQFSF